MTPIQPPRVAVYLLHHCVDNEPLVGDLLEEFDRRQSRVWFWTQTMTAIAVTRLRRPAEIRPLRLVETRISPLKTLSSERLTPIVGINALNISASPIRGVGGLGIVMVVVVSTMMQPGLWTLVAAGLTAGIVLGAARIARARRHAGDAVSMAPTLSLR